jgi:hypothetical protein
MKQNGKKLLTYGPRDVSISWVFFLYELFVVSRFEVVCVVYLQNIHQCQ